MKHHIDIQHASDEPTPVNDETLIFWATRPLQTIKAAELTLRLVSIEDITVLNRTYRKHAKPTNVLAFPSNLPKAVTLQYPFLGDVIICPGVLKQESEVQNKALKAHWAHIIIHGVLHLLGYDHIKDQEAERMQAVEIELLASLGFPNPYLTKDNDFA